ncbi:acylphosphatase-2 isoform X2 [Bos indicus x Bos taurus]|uniref:Acylphosphatase n=2 Tax=Bos TaxID=9903 RepID=A0AAA9S489_BOVIN|nr:acylphosphatase-2 isoform X2 [Bos taurus]XP_027411083.1 acylphosphatase-2 isoform X2 [Bos indicus x Bos taurus]
MCPLPLAAAAVTAPRSPLRLLGRGLAAAMSTGRPLKSVDYEVFGRVQGVCFRMYTEDEARKIGVVGWVKNTSKGTVTGQVQGPEEKVNSIGEKIQSWKVSCPRSQQVQKNTSAIYRSEPPLSRARAAHKEHIFPRNRRLERSSGSPG